MQKLRQGLGRGRWGLKVLQWGMWISVLSLVAGCELLVELLLPACVKTDCDCSDFSTQEEAQQVFDAFPGDPYRLDQDGNGRVCESLPVAQKNTSSRSSKAHLTLGNPSDASEFDPRNYLINKPQYVLSYNRDQGTANWVSWQLNQSWLGSTSRQDNFRSDESLPEGWELISPQDYRDSGFDRGHMIPSADRTANPTDNSATFLMPNIIPQAPENNRGPWRELEEYSRSLVKQGKELYVIAGVYGAKQWLNNDLLAPSQVWKVIVVLEPGSGVQGVDESTRVIAVDIPNQDEVTEDWRTYQVSVDDIEAATGYDFLSRVPESVQTVIESQVQQ